MPRSVPRVALSELFTCTNWVTSWWAPNSFSQKARAKKPRSSPRFSRSIRNAPFSGVSVKIMILVLSDLPRCLDLVERLLDRTQSHKLIAFKILFREAMLHHLAMQLLHSRLQVVLEFEVRQEPVKHVEVDAIIAGVGPDFAGVGDPGRRHQPLHLISHIAYLIVLTVGADIDRLVMNDVARRTGESQKSAGNVAAMDQRPPRRSIAHDANFTKGHR